MHQDWYVEYRYFFVPNNIAITIHFQISEFWNTARITVHPASVIQAEGALAQFSCEIHLNAIGIKWSIAGVYLSQHHPAGVTTHSQGCRECDEYSS